MLDLNTLEDLSLLRESVDLECKLAQGQNGQGEIPKDFWPSYSAMANAHGGVVLLGVREKDGKFSMAGLSNAAKLRGDLFNNLNNPAKVSANLLTDAEVEELVVEGKTILAIRIPQATRRQKPVYLHGQPCGLHGAGFGAGGQATFGLCISQPRHEVRLADSFEPYEQTTLEMSWGRGFTGVLTETPLKTPLKTPEKILAAMRHQADITIPELAHLLEKSESAVKRAIRKLRDADQIERIGGDKGGHWEVRS